MKLSSFKKNIKVSPETKYLVTYIFSFFIVTRILLTAIGIAARIVLEGIPHKQYAGSPHLGLAIWGVWDTGWYMDIAKNGYYVPSSYPITYDSQQNWAFFPLYPLLMKFIGFFLGHRYYLAGLLISNICLIIASFLLYYLVDAYYGRKIALNSVKFLYLFPIAFIFSGVFTESIYLALTLSCFFFSHKRNYLLVGLSGFFLALTRTLGVLIIIPMLYELLINYDLKLNKIKWQFLYLMLIPLGLIVFASYNYYLTGDFLAFKNIQAAPGWNRHITNPLIILFNSFWQGFVVEINIRIIIEFLMTFLSILSLLIFSRKLNFSFLLFSAYSILIPLSTSIDSMPRYVLPIFPLYIILAKLSDDKFIEQLLVIAVSLIQGVLMIFWSYGMAIII